MDGNGNGNGNGNCAWLSGCEMIAAILGVNRHDIPDLVKNEDLPAFKWRGRWRLLHEDVPKWTRNMAKKYRGRAAMR